MIGSQLRRYRDDQQYLGPDFETTGLNLAESLPWELAFALFTNKRIISIQQYYIRWPSLLMSDDAARVTRFNRAKYEQEARDPKEVLAIYESHLYDPKNDVVMQNGLFFDVYIHDLWRKRCGLKSDFSYLSRYIDTIALTKAFKKGWTPDLVNFLSWQYKACGYREKGLKSSLESTGKDLGIQHDYSNLHAAGSDVELMAKIFQQQIWKIEV